MSEQQHDWQVVVDRSPKGYVELNNGERVLHGPIEKVEMDAASDCVIITLKWAAQMPLRDGVPSGGWTVADNRPIVIPNLLIPFVIEDTPNKGPRVRFGFSIMYFDEVQGVDPSRVEGLVV